MWSAGGIESVPSRPPCVIILRPMTRTITSKWLAITIYVITYDNFFQYLLKTTHIYNSINMCNFNRKKLKKNDYKYYTCHISCKICIITRLLSYLIVQIIGRRMARRSELTRNLNSPKFDSTSPTEFAILSAVR